MMQTLQVGCCQHDFAGQAAAVLQLLLPNMSRVFVGFQATTVITELNCYKVRIVHL
jgi:hypothetical protein